MIYLDNNSTTRVDDSVLLSMMPFFTESYGNPASIKNQYGRDAEKAINDALRNMKYCFNSASINDFIITSGATEANNLAISGILNSVNGRKHVITTCIEHPSILNVCKWWEFKGVKCTYLPVNEHGIISVDDVINSITDDTCLISVMAANNEIGTIQPIADVAEVARHHNIFFHTDATQYISYRIIDLNKIPIDMMSVSSHKIHGPKGVGFLYASEHVRNKLTPMIMGGGQQDNLRSGTLNVPGIIGMAKAIEILSHDQDRINENLLRLRSIFLRELSKNVCVYINGSLTERIPNNVNLRFPGVPANALIGSIPELALSTGSACSANRPNETDYVLESIGLATSEIRSSLRIGLSKYTTESEIRLAAKLLSTRVEEMKDIYE